MARNKKNKHLLVKGLINSGDIKTISKFMDVIDKTPFADDSHTTVGRLGRIVNNMGLFRFDDVHNMSEALDMDEMAALAFFYKAYIHQRTEKQKK